MLGHCRSQRRCSGQPAPRVPLPMPRDGAGFTRSLKYVECKLVAAAAHPVCAGTRLKGSCTAPRGTGSRGAAWAQVRGLGAPCGPRLELPEGGLLGKRDLWVLSWGRLELESCLLSDHPRSGGRLGCRQLGVDPTSTPGLDSSLAPTAPVHPPAAWRCFPTLSLGSSVLQPRNTEEWGS